jgi:hypothetical protein
MPLSFEQRAKLIDDLNEAIESQDFDSVAYFSAVLAEDDREAAIEAEAGLEVCPF